jgi:hypothetical protein
MICKLIFHGIHGCCKVLALAKYLTGGKTSCTDTRPTLERQIVRDRDHMLCINDQILCKNLRLGNAAKIMNQGPSSWYHIEIIISQLAPEYTNSNIFADSL